MYTFKELKRATKQDTVSLPKLKVALLGDTATQLLATAIKERVFLETIILNFGKLSIIKSNDK